MIQANEKPDSGFEESFVRRVMGDGEGKERRLASAESVGYEFHTTAQHCQIRTPDGSGSRLPRRVAA